MPKIGAGRNLQAAADDYVGRGWTLVPVANKRPIGSAWNTATKMHDAASVRRVLRKHPQANGVGVLLAESGLCSFDPDDLDRTRAGLAKLADPVDVAAVLASGWHIRSGKPNSARALFAAPKTPKTPLRWLRLRVRKPRDEWKPDKDGTLHPAYAIVFELRATSPNLQDVLPPSLHPCGTAYSAKPPPASMPTLRGPLLRLWRRWMANPKQVERELFDAFGVPVEDRAPSLSGVPGKLDFPSACRVPYNDANEVETVLKRSGYTQHDGERWAHPGATGMPGCMPIPGKAGLWQSHNGGDPLCGTFDAWMAHVVLDHDSDQGAAEAAWYAWHPKGSEFETIEGDEDTDEDAADEELLRGLPALPDEALYGILRPIVEAATRHSEATRTGVAVSALVEFAARYGGALRLQLADNDRTVPLYVCLVGPTGKGRKGTSASFPRKLFEEVDELLADHELWTDDGPCELPGKPQVVTGVSSGQGIIDLVRDEGQTITAAGVSKTIPGAQDKRLLIDLSEFASVLVVSAQEGNILSQVLRDAFDGMPLASPARTNQLRATGAHICVLGHITMHEFRKHTVESKRSTDVSNGLLNRFAIVFSAREKLVPNPLPVCDLDRFDLASVLAHNVRKAFRKHVYIGPNQRRVVEIRLNRAACEKWDAVYAGITGDRYDSAVVDALMGRREALVRMLAVLLAAINGEEKVSVPALDAALAWSRYMAESTSRVFASATQRKAAAELRRDIVSITEWAKTRDGHAFSNRDLVQRWSRGIAPERRSAALRAMLESAPAVLLQEEKVYRLNGLLQ